MVVVAAHLRATVYGEISLEKFIGHFVRLDKMSFHNSDRIAYWLELVLLQCAVCVRFSEVLNVFLKFKRFTNKLIKFGDHYTHIIKTYECIFAERVHDIYFTINLLGMHDDDDDKTRYDATINVVYSHYLRYSYR